MALPTIPDIRVLMDNGVHFGHASGKWHPKMKPYIFATRDKLHIIDLEKTREKLQEVLAVLENRIASGKTVVLVGTKNQSSDLIKEIGEKHGLSYVNVRWLGGIMTNFAEVQKSITRMKKSEAYLESEESAKMLKKERARLDSELKRMHYKFGGLRNLTRKPDALFIIDPSHEHNAVKEARHEGIELFAVVDTNCDPSQIDHVIPANDDAPKSVALLLDLIDQTIQSGLEQLATRKTEEAAAASKKAEEVQPVEQTEAEKEVEDLMEEEMKEEAVEEEMKPARDADKAEQPADEKKETKKTAAKKTTKK